MKKIILSALFAVPVLLSAAIVEKDDVLLLTTSKLKMEFDLNFGMITSVATQNGDSFTGEAAPLPEAPFRKSLVPSGDTKGIVRKKNNNAATVEFKMENGCIIYHEIITEKDDILIRSGVKNANLKKYQDSIDLHIAYLKPDAVITGKGSKTLRKDPARSEMLLWPGSSFYFPRVIMLENKKNCVMIYNESAQPYHNLHLYHTPESDHVILRGGDHGLLFRTGKTLLDPKNYCSGYWRFSVHSDWAAAARYWRKEFEKRTGARPLWKNKSSVARKIHAVYTGTPNLGWKEKPEEYYKKLASEFNPENLLLLYWNANSIVTLCDHTYTLKPNPTQSMKDVFRKLGFQWMAFHGYTLTCNESAIATRHAPFKRNKSFPANYKFNPDYQGKPEDFYKNMDPYLSRRSGPLAMLNPASKYVADYLVRNINNYVKYHDAIGCYLDISGAVHYALKPDKIVFDGRTYTEGDVEVFRRLREANPELLTMTEYSGEWIIPYNFYVWQSGTVFRKEKIRINHPIRAALFGSYVWTREKTTDDFPLKNVYYATLPEVVAGYGSKNLEKDLYYPWYVERAKLFVREKLFNDIPPGKWDPAVLGYYRSEKNGFFQFRKTKTGYAYTDAKGNELLGIYENVTRGNKNFYIADWMAYDSDGRAIGLNPEKSYMFIKTPQKLPFVITKLSKDTYLDQIRSNKDWTTILLASGKAKTAEFSVKFDSVPAKVLLSGKEIKVSGKEWKTSAALPASLVVYHKNPVAAAPEKMLTRTNWKKGFIGINGVRESHGYRGYFYNFEQTFNHFTANKVKKTSLNSGCGHYSSYNEKLVKIPAGKTKMKLEFALNNKAKQPMILAVSANGIKLADLKIQSKDAWQNAEFNIEKFAGQDTIITITFRYPSIKDSKPANINNVLHVAGISFE